MHNANRSSFLIGGVLSMDGAMLVIIQEGKSTLLGFVTPGIFLANPPCFADIDQMKAQYQPLSKSHAVRVTQ